MEALGVVVAFDEGEDFHAGISGVDEASVLQHLGFERAHEGLGPGVVIGIGAGGHALAHAGVAQHRAEGFAAILAPTVAVEPSAERQPAAGCPEGVRRSRSNMMPVVWLREAMAWRMAAITRSLRM